MSDFINGLLGSKPVGTPSQDYTPVPPQIPMADPNQPSAPGIDNLLNSFKQKPEEVSSNESYIDSAMKGAGKVFATPPPVTGFEPSGMMEGMANANRSYLQNLKNNPKYEEEELNKQFPNAAKGTAGKLIEKGTEGAALGAFTGPAGIVPGFLSGAAEEAFNEAVPGHENIGTGVGIATGIGGGLAAPKAAEFAIKGGRSILEQFGAAMSPANSLYKDMGALRGPRIAGANDSWDSLQKLQNATREGIGGSGKIKNTEKALFDTVENRARGIADNLGPDLSHQELGEFIQGGARNRAAQIKQEINSMYDALDQIVPRATEVDPVNFRNALGDILGKYTGAPNTGRVFGDPAVDRMFDAVNRDIFRSPNGALPYDVIKNMRTDIGESIQKGALNPDINVKQLRSLYRSLTSDMESAYSGNSRIAAQLAVNPLAIPTPPQTHALRAFQTVNSAAETMFDNIERLQAVTKIGLEPETIASRLLAQSKKGATRIDDITSQLNNVDPEARSTVMGYVLRRLGETPDKQFDPSRFYSQWQQLSPEAKALYPRAQQEGIDRLGKVSGLIANSFEDANRSKTATNENTLYRIGLGVRGLIGAMATAAGGAGAKIAGQDPVVGSLVGSNIAMTLSATLGESGTNRMIAQLLTSPTFNIWLATEAPKIPVNKLSVALGALAAQTPDIAQGVNALKEQISGDIPAPNQDKPRFAEGGSVQYDTTLTPQEELDFQIWKMKNAPNDSGEDYDLRGAFKAGLQPAENGHWSDQFKKPNHETFSNESMYSKQNPDLPAGSWDGDRFIPPAKYAMGGPANENEMQGRSGSLIDLFMGNHMPMGGGGAGGRGKSYDYYKMNQSATPNENVGFINKQTPEGVITGKVSDKSTAWDTNFEAPKGMQRIPGVNSNEQLAPQEWQDMNDFAHGSFFNGFAEGGAVNLFEETEGIDPNPRATFMESDMGNKAILDYVFPGWQGKESMPDVPIRPWHQRIFPNTINNELDRESEINPRERFTDPRFEKQDAPWRNKEEDLDLNGPVFPRQSFEDAAFEKPQPSYAEGGAVEDNGVSPEAKWKTRSGQTVTEKQLQGQNKRYYTFDEMRQLAANAGFKGQAINTMAAIGMAESRGDSKAYNGKGENSYGLTQINADAHGPKAKGALNAQTAFNLAFDISNGGTNFRPWTMYTNGQYQQYLSGNSGETMLANRRQEQLTSAPNRSKQPTGPTQLASNQSENQNQPSSILQTFMGETSSSDVNEEEESNQKKQKLAQSHIDEVPWADPLTKYAIKGIWENANI